MPVAVGFINMKGGVGKTTLVSQLAFAADDAGFRVLAVDLDPQSNLGHALGVRAPRRSTHEGTLPARRERGFVNGSPTGTTYDGDYESGSLGLTRSYSRG